MDGAVHRRAAPQPARQHPTWQTYLAELLAAPLPAKAALLGCCILMIISPAGLSAMTPFTTASYAAETGKPLPQAMLLFVAAPLLISPLILPLAGAWVDRWGAKKVAIPAAILYAAATALIPLTSSVVGLFGLVIILASVFGFTASLAVAFKVITSWFPRHRGIGFAFMGAVSSLAAAVLSPVFQTLIGTGAPAQGAAGFNGVGWDGAYYLVAAFIAVIAVPTAVFMISEPKGLPVETDKPAGAFAPPDAPGVPMRQALKSRTWIFIAILLALAAAGPMAVRQNAVVFFAERGFDAPTIALSLSALFVASIIGLFAGGMVLDRSSKPWVIVPILATVPIGLALAYLNHGFAPGLFLSTALLGFATGAESSLGPFLIARYFGLKCFAQLQGLTLAISTLTLGLSPFLVSAIKLGTGSYLAPFAVLTALAVIAPILAALLPPYPAEWKHAIDEIDEEPRGIGR